MCVTLLFIDSGCWILHLELQIGIFNESCLVGGGIYNTFTVCVKYFGGRLLQVNATILSMYSVELSVWYTFSLFLKQSGDFACSGFSIQGSEAYFWTLELWMSLFTYLELTRKYVSAQHSQAVCIKKKKRRKYHLYSSCWQELDILNHPLVKERDYHRLHHSPSIVNFFF